jgi:plastocyanin
MKKRCTSKNSLKPHLFFLSALILLFSTPVFSQVKHLISVTKNKFTPQELAITVGDTVEWRNTDGYHNVNGNQTTYPMNPESFRNGDPASTNWTFSYIFTMAGKYDYQCDPHVGLGMVGTIEVVGTVDDGINTLTVNFSGMNPHVEQTLWIAVIDKDSGKEIERKSEIVSVAFSMQISGLEMNHSYNVDFFADHNKNGTYDAPPTDHAWRLELNNFMGDTTLLFNHNTSFNDIMWITTSVSDLANSTFKLYPNPASNKVTIESPKISSNSALKISIYDISGKLKQQYQKSFSNKTDVDIHDLNPGIYFFDLRTNKYQKVFRIVKY